MIKNSAVPLGTVKEKLVSPITCVIRARSGEELLLQENGIKPLMGTYQSNPTLLQGAQVADKIIGRAAAAILILGGIAQLYAEVLSEGAAALLQAHGIAYEYGTLVQEIRNRTSTGCCPMEAIAAAHTTPGQIYAALCAKLCGNAGGTAE